MLREARLTKKEMEALNKSLRSSKRKPKINIPPTDQVQTPPYAILPLLPYFPKDWIVWDSAASKYGFMGEAIRSLHGNVVIESGLELDGWDFLQHPPKTTAQVQITHPPASIIIEWIERSFDNRQAFALLMPFNIWTTIEAQSMFQRYGISVILLNRPIRFHLPTVGWGKFDAEGNPKLSKSDQPMAWFTWGLPFLKEPVTYGYIPLLKNLPQWMVRPNHRGEITVGSRSMQDRLAIRQATNSLQWPAPTMKGGTQRGQERM
jgi:hypothetical protein